MESPGPSVRLQQTLKDNTEALHDFLADLKSWEQEMKAADQALLRQSSKEKENPDTPPVRSPCLASPTKQPNKQAEKSKETKQAENKQMASSSSSSSKKAKRLPCDYAAWDKFDVDKALESSEEEKEEGEGEHKQPKSPSSGRNPRASKKERATALKEEGNKLYGRGRLEDAVAKYTQGMALDPTNALLPANRAMAYIKLKKFTAAEADCNRCLKLDCNYIKGFLRRATSRLGLGKEELARRDYLKVLEMEPHNKEARRGLDQLNAPSTGTSESEPARNSTTEQGQHTAPPSTNDRLTSTQQPTREPSTALKDTAPPRPSVDTQREGTATKATTASKGKGTPEMTAIKREGSGKRVKIVEVDSSTTSTTTSTTTTATTTTAAKVVANQIFPIDKPPHLRSKKPLKRIPVRDVATPEEITEERVASAAAAAAVAESKKTEKPPAVPLETAVLVSAKATVPTVPRTSHQFSQDWHRLSRTPGAAWEYLKMIPPTFFRSVDLETNTLVEVAEVLAREDVPSAQAAQYLAALSVSHGFSISLMFLEAEQKQVFVNLITKCKQVEGHAAKMEELQVTLDAL